MEEIDQQVLSRWEELMKEHLLTSPRAHSEDAWMYKQRLIRDFGMGSFWDSVPGAIRIWVKGEPKLICLNDVRSMPLVTTTVTPDDGYMYNRGRVSFKASQGTVPSWDNNVPTLTDKDLEWLSSEHRNHIFANRSSVSVRWLSSGHLAIDWESCPEHNVLFAGTRGQPIGLAVLPDASTIGFPVHKTTDISYNHCLLNSNNLFVKWLMLVKAACATELYGLKAEHFEGIISLLQSPLGFHGLKLPHLIKYLERWRQMPNLPPELYPPDIQLTDDMFSDSPHEIK
jgi:hypothetical protein